MYCTEYEIFFVRFHCGQRSSIAPSGNALVTRSNAL